MYNFNGSDDEDFDPPDTQGYFVLPDPAFTAKCKADFDAWYDNWQCVNFEKTDNGLRIFSVGAIHPLNKPVVKMNGKLLQVQAKFFNVLQAGKFCKKPHKLINFVGSHY